MKHLLIVLVFIASNCCGQIYLLTQGNYSAPSMSGTTIQMADDARSAVIDSPFTICFYGNQYNQFYIGSNGWVSFSPNQPIAFTAQMIPVNNIFVPRNCIMAPWHDMRPDIAGFPATPIDYVRYRFNGVFPTRTITVSWDNIPMYQCIGVRSSQQIVIHESGVIEIYIIQKATCTIWANGTATLGLHNANATQAMIVAGRNATVWGGWSFVPERWIFTPVECCYDIQHGINMN